MNDNKYKFKDIDKLVELFIENKIPGNQNLIRTAIENLDSKEINVFFKSKILKCLENNSPDETLKLVRKYMAFNNFSNKLALEKLLVELSTHYNQMSKISGESNSDNNRLQSLLNKYYKVKFKVTGKTNDGLYYCRGYLPRHDAEAVFLIDSSASLIKYEEYEKYLEFIKRAEIVSTLTNVYYNREIDRSVSEYDFYEIASSNIEKELSYLKSNQKYSVDEYNEIEKNYNIIHKEIMLLLGAAE